MGLYETAHIRAEDVAVVSSEFRPPPKIPWECECGVTAKAPPFVIPKGWTHLREEEGTGLIPTLKQERVLCPGCTKDHQEVSKVRRLRRCPA